MELSPQTHFTQISISLLGIIFKLFPENLRKMHNFARLKKKKIDGEFTEVLQHEDIFRTLEKY